MTSKFDAQEVIDAGHPPVAKGVVCVDFDGTIFPWGNLYGTPKPIPGVVNAMKALKAAGYSIVIFSSRFSERWHRSEGWDHNDALVEQEEYVIKALESYGIPFDELTSEKIPAQAYFDDKAFRAEGEYGLWRAVGEFLGEGAML